MKICDINSLTYIQDCKPFLNWFLHSGEYLLGLTVIIVGFSLLIIYMDRMKFAKQEIPNE